MRSLVAVVAGVALFSASAHAQSPNALVAQYCVSCHGEQRKPAGGLTLAGFDASAAEKNAEVAERVIRKLRAGMMPPPGSPRPDTAAIRALVDELETRIDARAAANPQPGWRPFQRLNRA